MRARITIAFVLMTALVVLLWVAANTSAVPIIRAAITVIPPPPIPKPPSFVNASDELRFRYQVQMNKANRVRALNPCEQELHRLDMAAIMALRKEKTGSSPIADITSNAGARSYLATVGTIDGSLSATIINGQQALEAKKLETESQERRLKMGVQAGLTLLLAVAGLYVILNKKATPTQRAGAAAAMGVALGYWFK
jgi:hypothetical protein